MLFNVFSIVSGSTFILSIVLLIISVSLIGLELFVKDKNKEEKIFNIGRTVLIIALGLILIAFVSFIMAGIFY